MTSLEKFSRYSSISSEDDMMSSKKVSCVLEKMSWLVSKSFWNHLRTCCQDTREDVSWFLKVFEKKDQSFFEDVMTSPKEVFQCQLDVFQKVSWEDVSRCLD